MKYRLLSDDELKVFEEDLKHFLVVNGLENDTWTELNKNDPAKALGVIELFSDTVLQKVYENIKFIEHRSKNSCMVFHLKEKEIELISINGKPGSTVDLSTPESIHDALVNNSGELNIFQTKKNYSKEREVEIHEMIASGCVNSSEAFWILLQKVIK